MLHFGERLRHLRGNRSQKDVARELGIPQTTLSTLENQERAPRGERLQELVDFFGVPAEYFLGEQSAEPSPSARAWLMEIRSSEAKSARIATHSGRRLSDQQEQQIREKIREKAAQAPHDR